MFGSRWGAAPSTGAAQMPPKQRRHRLSRDAETRWSLLIHSHPQPSHLLSHSPGVITRGTGWAHDGCWEIKDRNLTWLLLFLPPPPPPPLSFNGNRLSEILVLFFLLFPSWFKWRFVCGSEVGPICCLLGRFSRCSVFQSHNGEWMKCTRKCCPSGVIIAIWGIRNYRVQPSDKGV